MKKIYTSPETKMVKIGVSYNLLSASVVGTQVAAEEKAEEEYEVLVHENRYSVWDDDWSAEQEQEQ